MHGVRFVRLLDSVFLVPHYRCFTALHCLPVEYLWITLVCMLTIMSPVDNLCVTLMGGRGKALVITFVGASKAYKKLV